ncbi:DUF2029 domain-containing protein [Phreatobacter aquaticus]|uniref:DUF2029 domain-containing protein n=1 Tax=Phreatobacter aquaticus TaxID=2570229 RepID=A0A4D7QPJ3_9HYPH|nr:glycosyltransferase family 87 protein [Phreatobacter aquaticus]QCK86867.1 DUF2029 domain-containing protein [Phreatobacter aquaticus]
MVTSYSGDQLRGGRSRGLLAAGRNIDGRLIFAMVLFGLGAWSVAALQVASGRGIMAAGGIYAIGRDFAIIWTAAQMARQGNVAEIFDTGRFMEAAHRLVDPALSFHMWSYPPTALINVLPLGYLPYWPAYLLWNLVGLTVLFGAGRLFFGKGLAAPLLLVSPAAAVNVTLGQNGFVSASLMLAGLALVDARPRLAGVLFGLLGFKPQLGILLPVGLLAARRYWPIATAALTGLGMVLVSAILFGPQAWVAFLASTVPAQTQMMVGDGPFRWMAPSAFMSGLILFGPGHGPMLAQAPFTILGCVLAWRAFRQGGDPALRAAVLIVATFVASPQAFNYDMIPVAAAALVLARASPTVLDLGLVCLLWCAPVLVVVVNSLGLPVIPLVMAAAAIRLDRISRAARPAALTWRPS